MFEAACASVYTILMFSLYSDEPIPFPDVAMFARALPKGARYRTIVGTLVSAAATSACGRFDDAISLLQGAEVVRYEGASNSMPSATMLLARILYKAERYREAQKPHASLHGTGDASAWLVKVQRFEFKPKPSKPSTSRGARQPSFVMRSTHWRRTPPYTICSVRIAALTG
jgi:hypothetical protein